jgi:hypothetical protein
MQTLLKPGTYILLVSLIAALVWEPNQAFFWGSVLYGLTILNRKTDIEETKCKVELFDPTTPQIIENLIAECFDEYIVFNEGYKDKEYISEEDEERILKIVTENVLAKMSEPVLIKIRAFYNKESVEENLSKKIYMIVMNYSIKNNLIEQTKNLELESARKRKDLTPIL